MPTYEYRCNSCGNHLEVVQSFADDPLTECSACGGKLRKVFAAVGIVFKGSGFYKTDNRAGKKTSSTEPSRRDKESSSESASGSSSSSSSGDSSKSSSGSDSSGRDSSGSDSSSSKTKDSKIA